MESIIKKYEREYKRINMIYYVGLGLSVIACVFFWWILAIYKINVIYLSIPMFMLVMILFNYRKNAYIDNNNQVNNILKNDLDIDLVLRIQECLLKRKNRKDYSIILISHLNMLFIAGEFQRFKDIYISNRKKLRKINMDYALNIFREQFYSVRKDRTEYMKILLEKKVPGNNLSKKDKRVIIKTQQNILHEIQQLYEIEEYKKIISKLENIVWDNAYDELIAESYKQCCLYKLKEEYAYPNEEIYPFIFIKKWKSLLDTGEEYTFSEAEEILNIIKQDITLSTRKRGMCFILMVLCFGFTFFMTYKWNAGEQINERVIEQFITQLETWDYETSEVYGVCKNDDITAAIIYAVKPGDNPEVIYLPVYYLAVIDYYNDGLVPKMRLDIQQMMYSGVPTLYMSEGETSTYVSIISDELSEISYAGKVLKDIRIDKVREASFFKEAYAHCFIMKGKIDPSLFEIE